MKKLVALLFLFFLSFSIFASSNNVEYSAFGAGYFKNNYKINGNSFYSINGFNISLRDENIINNTISYYSDISFSHPSLSFNNSWLNNYYDFQLLADYSTGINMLSSVGTCNFQYIGFGSHISSHLLIKNDNIEVNSFVGSFITIGFKSELNESAFLDIAYKGCYDFYNFVYDNSSNPVFSSYENITCFSNSINVYLTYEI